jgi:hypothetical protein
MKGGDIMEKGIVERFHMCCRIILKQEVKGYMRYGQAYAQAGLYMDGYEEIRSQISYILSNIQYWRGGQSKKVREELKKIMKELG